MRTKTSDEGVELQRSGGVVDLLPQSALSCCPCSTHEASRRAGDHCPVWKGVCSNSGSECGERGKNWGPCLLDGCLSSIGNWWFSSPAKAADVPQRSRGAAWLHMWNSGTCAHFVADLALSQGNAAKADNRPATRGCRHRTGRLYEVAAAYQGCYFPKPSILGRGGDQDIA